jgi:hypothetical protein
MHVILIFSALLLMAFLVWGIGQPKEKLQKAWTDIGLPFTAKNKDWATALLAWAETSLAGDKPLQTWLKALPKDGLQALGEKIADFGTEMNVDLDWLLTPTNHTTDAAEMQIAEQMVIDYCKICFRAVQNHKSSK